MFSGKNPNENGSPRAIESGIDPLTLMGRANLATTNRYVHLSQNHLAEAQKRIRGPITATAEPRCALTRAQIATRIESCLFVLPVAINTPGELGFVAREATGGGPPKARFSLETLRLPPSSLD